MTTRTYPLVPYTPLLRSPIAADLVVEHVDPEAVSGAPREPRLEVAAETVIAQNVDLQQKVVLCRFDRLEHGGKGFLAVLQQLDAVAAGERQSGELLEYPQVHRIRRQDGAVAAFEPLPQGRGDAVDLEIAGAAR